MTISCRTPRARSAPCWISNAAASALPFTAEMFSRVGADGSRLSSTSSTSQPPLDGANVLSMYTSAFGFVDLQHAVNATLV